MYSFLFEAFPCILLAIFKQVVKTSLVYLKFNNSFDLFLTAIRTNEKRKISVIPQDKNPNAPCKVVVLCPSGKPVDLPLRRTRDGYETQFGPSELGGHLVHVSYNNQELPQSPFPVDTQAVVDLNKVEIRGLEKRKWSYEILTEKYQFSL